MTTEELNQAARLTPERIAEIMTFKNTDFSDCPPLTPEQMARARPKYPERRRRFLEEEARRRSREAAAPAMRRSGPWNSASETPPAAGKAIRLARTLEVTAEYPVTGLDATPLSTPPGDAPVGDTLPGTQRSGKLSSIIIPITRRALTRGG